MKPQAMSLRAIKAALPALTSSGKELDESLEDFSRLLK